jgi:hypothetical protein
MPQALVTQQFKFSVGHENGCIFDLTKQGQLFGVSHKDYTGWLVFLLLKFPGSSSSC